MRHILLRTATIAATLFLGACATQPRLHGLPPCQTPRVTALTVPNTVPEASLRRMLDIADDKKGEADTQALAAARERVQQQFAAALPGALEQAGLTTTGMFSVEENSALARTGQALDAPTLVALQAAHPADVYMRLRLTDYGETPQRWKGAYVGFEVVTTLAVAGALFVHKVTRPVAGIYLLEEGTEELAEGYAGFWVLNRVSRPVRIEAELIDGHSGQVIWKDQDTGLSHWQWGHLWHMDATTRDTLIAQSEQKSLNQLAREVAEVLRPPCTEAACCASAAAP